MSCFVIFLVLLPHLFHLTHSHQANVPFDITKLVLKGGDFPHCHLPHGTSPYLLPSASSVPPHQHCQPCPMSDFSDCYSSQHLKSRLWFRKSFIWDTVHCLCIIYIIVSMSLNWKAESQTGRFPVDEVFCCSYFLQSRKVCCLEVRVTEKKKKRARKSSEVTSPSAVFKS